MESPKERAEIIEALRELLDRLCSPDLTLVDAGLAQELSSSLELLEVQVLTHTSLVQELPGLVGAQVQSLLKLTVGNLRLAVLLHRSSPGCRDNQVRPSRNSTSVRFGDSTSTRNPQPGTTAS